MPLANKYICIHGHFYQPPRENAWLETVEQQQSARPFHDWNARINFECYAPNAAARIMNDAGEIVKIRNNYNRISSNFGPTLLTWLQQNDDATYRLIKAADQRSMERFGGHGSLLAQVHSHLILPLCNYRDKVTQVVWGIRDFEHRFGRHPEGIWLAETAVDSESLEILTTYAIQFTILAPRQAKAIRKEGSENWIPVDTGTLDTRRPYWCVLPNGRRIAVFFYNGDVARDVAFNGLLNSGKNFSRRLMSGFDANEVPQLMHIATDGESYGHHHRFGEMALADALNHIEQEGVAQLTNYGQYLEMYPPEWEVMIHENSSWSCAHGVERWRNDCGCNTGGRPGWHQRWRKPLREALNWLRDQLIPLYEHEAGRYLRDPWAARNDYIQVMLNRSEANVQAFLNRNARRRLSPLEEVAVLRLLEMQRHALLMFTSCGWFFDEISGIETNQILQYALRCMDYAQDLTETDLHTAFTRRLAEAPSNVHPNGAASYLQYVVPSRVNLERVAMHFAVSSLFTDDPASLDLFNYTASVQFFEKIQAGTPQFAVGCLDIRSRLTHAEKNFCFAVLYIGQQHIIGNISGSMSRSTFDSMFQRTSKAFKNANIGEVIGILQEYFGPEKFTLATLFADEKIKIIRDITEQSLALADSNFRNVFNDNYQLMNALQDSDLPLPDAWYNIASYVLNEDLIRFFNGEETLDPRHLQRILEDMQRWKIRFSDEEDLRHAVGERVFREIMNVAMDHASLSRVRWLNAVLAPIQKTGLKPVVWKSQNAFYMLLRGYRKGEWVFIDEEWKQAVSRLAELLKVKI